LSGATDDRPSGHWMCGLVVEEVSSRVLFDLGDFLGD
jgi:hypothetical protein